MKNLDAKVLPRAAARRDVSSKRAYPILPLMSWLSVVATIALLGAAFPPDEWYKSLTLPFFNPPPITFAIVWPLLYLSMAIAAWLVQITPAAHTRKRAALGWMIVQLILNAAWTPIFFGLHQAGFAFAVLCALWLAVGATIVSFAAVRRSASWLLTPYFLWVSFALILNGSIWLIN